MQEAFGIVGVLHKANMANNMEEDLKPQTSSRIIIQGFICMQQVHKLYVVAQTFFVESFKGFWSAWAFHHAQKT